VPPPDSSNLVGQSAGPPPPPAVPGSRVDIQAEPQKPGPGQSTLLTITVSGSGGSDRYAVPNAKVEVQLSEKPDAAATVSDSSLTTDVSGSATTKLTLSTTKGRHVVMATSSGVSSSMVFDTLSGATANTGRARHSARLTTAPPSPGLNPAFLLLAAGFFLVAGFLLPYRERVLARLRPAPTAVPGPGVAAAVTVAAAAEVAPAAAPKPVSAKPKRKAPVETATAAVPRSTIVPSSSPCTKTAR